MIIDKPTPHDFEKQSIQYLVQSIDLIYKNEEGLEYFDDYDVTKRKYWKYHKGILNNSLTLLFLSFENFLKKEICNVSPLLLLADSPKKWGDKKNIAFNSLFIHQFDDLLALYQELGLGSLTGAAITKISDLKLKRNQITHGVVKDTITPKYILEVLYTIVIHVWGKGVFWNQLKTHIFNEPLFGLYDTDQEKSRISLYMDFFISYLEKKKTGEMLGVNLKQRNYYCPYCHYWLNYEAGNWESNYGILQPNSPKSTNLFCVVCGNNYRVSREKCSDTKCSGNVISEKGVCLTCFLDQDDER